ncbi:GGDEF domain-containing protein [Actinoplanes sp. ATCC 53533]|uniref:putative bifunctional diguanylate cyclase/phosphodiesterase n=1 Tax=Actinoplanes sp. ATCC 53533 TaxID=1288362 RepID=UPI000F7AAE29|nr:bifunctional diguanylate cyclase/phosphodiesterase [Actinoplanes sp. ATCC 53533]RSM54636.1 GGDEF domain-containing protein [Actinoplanes sp. ATCC 53533]
MGSHGDAGPATPAGLAGFAAHWRRQVAHEGFVPLDLGGLDALLRRLTDRLGAAFRAESFDPRVAGEVGSALVEAHLTEPAVLSATVSLIGTHLPAAVGDAGRHRQRVVEIQAAVAAGYAAAIRAATMAEQELLGRAVISAHAAAERALRSSEARLRAVFDGAAIGIGVSTMDGRIVQVNQAFADLLGYTAEEMCALLVPQLSHPEDPPEMWKMYAELIGGELDHVRMEKAYYRKDRGVVWTDLTVSLIRDEGGAPEFTIAMVQDITDRRRLKHRLEYQATHDPLTGLPNRTMIGEHLERIFGSDDPDARVGLCYLDLDGFKRVNDTLGHQVGDDLLVAVAQRLRECAAGFRQVAGRMSGDEFVLLVEHSSGAGELTELAGRTLAVLAEPYQLGQHRMRVSASIGVVESVVRETSAAELMKAADLTLYVAKSEGRGRYVMYDADRNAWQAARYELAAALPDALDRREFSLVYQPLVALADQRVTGVEALLRWHHPVLGELTPDAFIALAEETGIIVPLGRWVLQEACAQAAKWAGEFPELRVSVSVNITVSQVHEPTLPAEVEEILTRTGLDPALLVLELTESAIMDTNGPLQALSSLADSGIRIAIDDFGTGYSNFAYLRRLPVHLLKLAGPFVDGLRDPDGGDSVDERIVETIIRLAHTIGVSVTAEAVETRSQAERLRALGCDTGQGWLFSRPLRPAAVTDLLRRAAPVGAGPDR